MPDAYATYEDVASRVGEGRLGRLVSGKTETQTLEGVVSTALIEAAGEIDGYLQQGGFALPIQFSEVQDASQRLRLETLLEGLNVTLALMRLVTEPSDQMCKAAEDARSLLRALAAESYGLGGVRASRPAFGAADDTLEPEIPRDLVERHYRAFGAC